MKAVQKFCEPEWILDKTGSGLLHWRRDCSETNSRVKFRYEVDVKEFQRDASELDHQLWYQQGSEFIISAVCLFFCVSLTVVLPWYIFGQKY